MRCALSLSAVVTILFVCPGVVRGQVHNSGQFVPDTLPGAQFSLAGDNLPGKRIEASLTRDGVSHTILPVAIDQTRVTFRVPDELPPADYLVRVKIDDEAAQFVGQLTVTSPVKAAAVTPTVHRTLPTASWIKLWFYGLYDMDIFGERLPDSAADLTTDQSVLLYFGEEPRAVKACAPPTKDDPLTETNQTEPCYAMHTAQRLAIHGLPARTYGGPHQFAIGTAKGKSNAVAVRISRITPRMIKWLSLACFALLVASVGFLGKGVDATPGDGSQRRRLLAWVLLDQQTNTFSLSKVQLLMWMGTIVYCYVLLQLAFVFVQGKLEMAPLPAKFEWLLGITGGTTLVSAMLTRSRGSKGAGDAGPALSDLVSAGGMLAADRAQLLLWTIIGCCGYVLVVLRWPTEAIPKLPEINTDLLNAMGITALVYVGAKSVRLPGPIVNQVTTDVQNKTLTVKGQNLHRNALISLDRQPTEVADIKTTPTAGAPSEALSSELVLTLAAMPFTAGDHLLRVTNLDGQYAEAWFPADQPTISKVVVANGKDDEVPAGSVETTLVLSGSGFRAGSAAEWTAPGQLQPATIAASLVAVTSEQVATVKLTPGESGGAGTISLVSPHGTRTAHSVTVK